MATNERGDIVVGESTAADVEAKLGKPGRDVEGVTYGPTAGLRMMSYDDPQASLFLKDNRVFLVVTVVKAGGAYPTSIADWEGKYGKPQKILPSTHGKNFRIHVYGNKGLAATFNEHGRATIVETFSPMSADNYERAIYKVPTKFVK